MKLLLYLTVAVTLSFSFVNCAVELSTFVTNTDLGTIRPGSNGQFISDLRILNAFVRANPNLPPDLRATSQRGGAIIYVSVHYRNTNRAIIGVHTGTTYTGYVEVTYNGGPPPTPAPDSDSDSEAGGNTWSSRLNLSRVRNVVRNIGTLADYNDRTIIQAFLFNNQNLPNELIEVLRVRDRTSTSARLYVPQGNLRYEGEVVVSWTGSGGHNSRYPDEHL